MGHQIHIESTLPSNHNFDDQGQKSCLWQNQSKSCERDASMDACFNPARTIPWSLHRQIPKSDFRIRDCSSTCYNWQKENQFETKYQQKNTLDGGHSHSAKL